MSIADNALTLMNNVQAMAAQGNVNLRAIVYELRGMLDDVYALHAEEFDADIPDVSVADLPALIDEIEGYMQQVLDDAAAMENMLNMNADAAIGALETMMAQLVPGEASTELADIQVEFSSSMAAARAAAETARKREEVAVMAATAAKRFFLPTGVAMGAVVDIRVKSADSLGAKALEIKVAEQKHNAKLYVDRLEKQFAMQKELIEKWTDTYQLMIKLIGQLIADYEKTPLLQAEIAAATATALTKAYSGLNSSAIQITKAAGTTYKAQLSEYELQLLEDKLQAAAYEKGMDLTFAERHRIAAALASSVADLGRVANACIGSTTSHGSYVERAFQ